MVLPVANKVRVRSKWQPLVAAISLFLALADAGYAQFVWQLTDSNTAERNKIITALSCNGLHCTASGLLDAKTPPYKSTLFFLHSTNGGLSWSNQPAPVEPVFGHGQIINKVHQIDALTAVAVGDTALILRTTDGGLTWVQQELPKRVLLTAVHFSDPQTGIVVGAAPTSIFTTEDGGKHWVAHPADTNLYLTGCQSFGSKRYAVFAYGSGPIVSTIDGWQSAHVSSLLPLLIPETDDAYVFTNCHFVGPDSAIAYGNRLIVRDSVVVKGIAALVTTTDGGATWDQPYEDSTIRFLSFVSQFDDTIFACSQRTSNRILISTNRGLSWETDSLILPPVGINSVNAIYASGQGTYIGFFGQFVFNGPYLGIGHRATLHVEAYERIYHGTHCYPNPAVSFLRMHSVERNTECMLNDVFGRLVARAQLDDHGDATFDISRLSPGYYIPMLRYRGKMIPSPPIIVTR